MKLDFVASSELLLDKKLSNLVAVIPLELDDLTKFRVSDHCTIAVEEFPEGSQKFVEINLSVQALDGRNELARSARLHTNVNEVGVSGALLGNVIMSCKGITLVRKHATADRLEKVGKKQRS